MGSLIDLLRELESMDFGWVMVENPTPNVYRVNSEYREIYDDSCVQNTITARKKGAWAFCVGKSATKYWYTKVCPRGIEDKDYIIRGIGSRACIAIGDAHLKALVRQIGLSAEERCAIEKVIESIASNPCNVGLSKRETEELKEILERTR